MRDGNRCNILFINHASQMGGAEVSLSELVLALDTDAFRPIVVCPPGRLGDELEHRGITVRRMNIARFKKKSGAAAIARQSAGIPAAAKSLMNIVREHDVRIIHSNGTRAHMYGALVARLTGVPSVWHLRDSVRLGLLGRILQSVSSRIIVSSWSIVRSVFGEHVRRDKVVVVPPGLDLEMWSPGEVAKRDGGDGATTGREIRAEYGIGKHEVVIAMAAHLIPWKRHIDFIAAAGLVLSKRANVRFLIIGEDMFGDHPRYVEDLRKMVSDMKFGGKVLFTGRRNDMPHVMQSIDMLALPSLHEPFGRVIIEAMAMNKPVIATNDGGPAEIIEHGVSGFLVPPKRPDALAESMVLLIDDAGARQRMGSAGRSIVEARYEIRRSVAQIEAMYVGLVGR